MRAHFVVPMAQKNIQRCEKVYILHSWRIDRAQVLDYLE